MVYSLFSVAVLLAVTVQGLRPKSQALLHVGNIYQVLADLNVTRYSIKPGYKP